MRFWLLDLPALLVTWWFRIYYLIIAAATMVVMTVLFIELGSWWLLGIRWGW